MWCGPNAVAYLSGWTRDEVWLHIRAIREKQKRRLTAKPVGGTYLHELRHTLERAGFTVEPVFHGRRMQYRAMVREYGDGLWLLRQNGHIFARKPGDPILPTSVITDAYRVHRDDGR